MTNGKMILRFEPDIKTGMPHLVDPGGCLTASVHADWEAELKGRCNDQSLGGDEVIRFTTKARNLPTEFRVRAERGESNRMPSYVLEPVEPAPPAPAAAAPPPPAAGALPVRPVDSTAWSVPVAAAELWPAGFLLAARKMAREQPADRMGRHGLQYVLEEIHELARDYPDELLVLTVSSYTAIRKLACAGNPTLAREEQFYDRALEALEFSLRAVAAESHTSTLGSLLGAVSRCFSRRNRT